MSFAFTNPAADGLGMPGVGYQARADAQSWAHMQSLLQRVFK